jgi:hypothetical protein
MHGVKCAVSTLLQIIYLIPIRWELVGYWEMGMKLEDAVTSLELSRKLFEFGFKRESLFIWGNIRKHQLQAGLKPTVYFKQCSIEHWDNKKRHIQEAIELGEILPAYTPAELGEILDWKQITILGLTDCLKDFFFNSNTEADARAKMLIYLIENNYIKL